MGRRLLSVAGSTIGAILLVLFSAAQSAACVGEGCLQLRSTADGGGALTLRHDFTMKVQTVETLPCTSERSQCLYSTIDPGFRAEDDIPRPGYFRLVDGTTVRVEIVASDPPLSLSVNGEKLHDAGDSAVLGTMPDIHNHPAWQLLVPAGEVGDYRISYKLTTDSSLYSESAVFTSIVTNVAPPSPSPTPTRSATATPAPCSGDCDGNGAITVNELVRGVSMALSLMPTDACPSFDADGSTTVSIDELVQAVNGLLKGCSSNVRPVHLTEIQDAIFSPRCAIPTCHEGANPAGNLSLVAEDAFDQLVNVAPDIEAARLAGMLRVAPGEPERSFLLAKVQEPPPGQGSRMPLTGDPLPDDDMELIRRWIAGGALP